MPPVIRLDRLTKRFGAEIALDEVSLEVPPGVVFALFALSIAGVFPRRQWFLGSAAAFGLAFLLLMSIAAYKHFQDPSVVAGPHLEMLPGPALEHRCAEGVGRSLAGGAAIAWFRAHGPLSADIDGGDDPPRAAAGHPKALALSIGSIGWNWQPSTK